MLELTNNTPFAASLALFPNEQGIDTLYVMVSATFTIGRRWTLAEEQPEPKAEDEYWGDDPLSSSIKYASEMHTGKPSTDIVMVGHARAPMGRPVDEMDVGLKVAKVSKLVRVFGDRQWQGGSISAPQPFETMPLIYERAYGGVHIEDGQMISGESYNPAGCGYLGKRKTAVLDGTLVPNIETPGQLIRRAGDTPSPAGFGFIAPHWLPRAQYAGTYDENWQTRRAPYLPDDFDPRFLNAASPGLVYPGYLQGGEPVQVIGVHPDGALKFKLPMVGFSANVEMHGDSESLRFNLETVLIEPDSLSLTLSWRAAMTCDKKAPRIQEVVIGLSRKTEKQVA